MMPSAPAVLSTHFADAFGFTLDELALNRLGKLSAGQTWHIARQAVIDGLFVLLLIAAAIVVAFVLSGAQRIYALAMFAIGLPLVLWGTWGPIADAFVRRAAFVDGTVEYNALPKSLAVDADERKLISKPNPRGGLDPKSFLVPGTVYRVYYLPHTDAFLSIEPR